MSLNLNLLSFALNFICREIVAWKRKNDNFHFFILLPFIFVVFFLPFLANRQCTRNLQYFNDNSFLLSHSGLVAQWMSCMKLCTNSFVPTIATIFNKHIFGISHILFSLHHTICAHHIALILLGCLNLTGIEVGFVHANI